MQSKRNHGFTLLELMTVVIIIAILALMILQAVDGIESRAEQAKCTTNLYSLYVGVSSYMQEQGTWPQIDPSLDPEPYAVQWIGALSRYGISQKNWLCPSIQRYMGNPDMSIPANIRVDYFASPFDNKPRTPYRWSNQPWFIEKGSPHPGGNLIIYEDGSTLTLVQAAQRPSPAQD